MNLFLIGEVARCNEDYGTSNAPGSVTSRPETQTTQHLVKPVNSRTVVTGTGNMKKSDSVNFEKGIFVNFSYQSL